MSLAEELRESVGLFLEQSKSATVNEQKTREGFCRSGKTFGSVDVKFKLVDGPGAPVTLVVTSPGLEREVRLLPSEALGLLKWMEDYKGVLEEARRYESRSVERAEGNGS